MALSNDENEDLGAAADPKGGLHMWIRSIPQAGGELANIARLPLGEVNIGPRGMAYAAKGQVAIIDRVAGSSKALGAVGDAAKSPVWGGEHIVVLAREAATNKLSLVLLSVDGSTRSLGSIAGTGDAEAISTGDESFMASDNGAMVRIDRAGSVSQIGASKLGVLSCIAATTTHLWWGHLA